MMNPRDRYYVDQLAMMHEENEYSLSKAIMRELLELDKVYKLTNIYKKITEYEEDEKYVVKKERIENKTTWDIYLAEVDYLLYSISIEIEYYNSFHIELSISTELGENIEKIVISRVKVLTNEDMYLLIEKCGCIPDEPVYKYVYDMPHQELELYYLLQYEDLKGIFLITFYNLSLVAELEKDKLILHAKGTGRLLLSPEVVKEIDWVIEVDDERKSLWLNLLKEKNIEVRKICEY